MEHFTPLSAALGGALIGLSAAILWLGDGRVAGISGIVGQLAAAANGWEWRLAFVLGLFAAPILFAAAFGPPAIEVTASLPTVAVAGFLVGFGTRLGSGCTSGHGVCGIARLSRRSIAATAVFMASAAATVFVVRHAFGV